MTDPRDIELQIEETASNASVPGAEALPPDHPVPSLTYSVGPFDAQEGSHGAE